MMAAPAMRWGCCGGLADAAPIREAGYDYIELPVGTSMSAEDEAAYRRVVHEIGAIGLPVEACNVFIPAALKITGPNVEREPLWRYAATALERMGELGVRVCVFGSGGARSIPEGFDRATALDQLQAFLEHVQDASARSTVSASYRAAEHEGIECLQLRRGVGPVQDEPRPDGIGVLAISITSRWRMRASAGHKRRMDGSGTSHVADADRSPPGEGPGGLRRVLSAPCKRSAIRARSVSKRDGTTSRGRSVSRGDRGWTGRRSTNRALAFVRQQWECR